MPEEPSRRRYTPAEKTEIVAEGFRSGDWRATAARHGVSVSSLLDWKRRAVKSLSPGQVSAGLGFKLEAHIRSTPEAQKGLAALVRQAVRPPKP